MSLDHTRSHPPEVPPLVMTALLDEQCFSLFDRLRREFFPPARNVLHAHLTLFHHLPGEDRRRLDEEMRRIAAATAPMRFRAEAVRMLGRGVAIEIDCPPLRAVREALAAQWAATLSAQDRGRFAPHVTVQNKATPEAARAVRPVVEAQLPVEGMIEGLALFVYRGGPWEAAGTVAFDG